MMSLGSKKELTEAIRNRYLKANKAGKGRILDEFIAATGYHRKYAIRLLRHGRKPKSLKKKGRKKKYQGEVIQVLIVIWEICGRICSKRLQPFLPELVSVLERFHEIELSDETKTLLFSMSSATIDRCLRKERFEHRKGLSSTKPGSLLKNQIPIQTFTPWEDEKPGFLEIDLVAHCGGSLEGQFLYTLTATDVATGWTECVAIPNKTQIAVTKGVQLIRRRLPFPLLGVDSDNGAEFINATLLRYCREKKITFTRSRPYRKNDQAHVEQKNWSVVRHTVGYDRFESVDDLGLLNHLYADLRLYINFFQPVFKLIAKEHLNEKTKKIYDIPSTPYRRVLASDLVPFQHKVRLTNLFVAANPVAFRANIDNYIARLWHLVR